MSATGRTRRMARIRRPATGRMVILPLDLVMPLGPIAGAADQRVLIEMAGALGVDAVLLRWGEARRLAGELSPDVGLIVRLTGSTFTAPDAEYDALLNSVEASLAIGADAVCVDLKLGGPRELEMMRNVGRACEACERLGAVCLVEAWPLEGVTAGLEKDRHIPWAARVAQELGADIVKVPNPRSVAIMADVAAECQVPVVVAGGSQTGLDDLFRNIDAALKGGAQGTAIGRNVTSSADPQATQLAILGMVHEQLTADEALAAAVTSLEA
jgi:DhnA family fructose-bisphosphate aldolase class Ia